MAGAWKWLIGAILVLLVAVVGLDRWQASQGEASLFRLAWPGSEAPASPTPGHQRRPAVASPPVVPARGGPRVAVIVDDLGARRDVFERLREVRRPLTIAVLPELPLSAWMAREARHAGLEVLVDLPMEPYRYPELDPGPGALLMGMSGGELERQLRRHLEALPGAVGVTNHMGSRMTEDRGRMRAVLSPLAPRRLFFVDAVASNLSVAYDEARRLGLKAGRRQVIVDHGGGEAGDREQWDEVGRLARRRGEVIVIAHGHPLTVQMLREYIPRWESDGMRLVPISALVH
jgi:uncharacterized protein